MLSGAYSILVRLSAFTSWDTFAVRIERIVAVVVAAVAAVVVFAVVVGCWFSLLFGLLSMWRSREP